VDPLPPVARGDHGSVGTRRRRPGPGAVGRREGMTMASKPAQISSVVGGQDMTQSADPHVYRSINPSRVDDTVAEVHLADADAFARACAVATEAQPAWADVPAPVRGRAIATIGRL